MPVKDDCLQSAWRTLSAVEHLRLDAQSNRGPAGWNGQGTGRVRVESVGENVLEFHESGAWMNVAGKETTFTNVYRWTLESDNNQLQLEHLRFGADHSVYLFHMALKV